MAFPDNILKVFGWKNKSISRKVRPDDLSSQESPASRYYNNAMSLPYERRKKYDLYDDMDEIDDVVSILDAYAEDSTQEDKEQNASIWIKAEDPKVQKELTEMFQRIKVEELLEPTTRDLGKYGDDFWVPQVDDDLIVGADFPDPRDMERVEHKDGTLLGFESTEALQSLRQSYSSGGKIELTYKPWEVVHFRLYKRKRRPREKFRNIYGTSLLDGSEKVAKQLRILSDMLVIHRMLNSIDRMKYGVWVGNAPTEEEILVLKRWKDALKRKPYVDPVAGRYDQNFDPTAWVEDIFWPMRGEGESSVDVIQGRPNVGDIVDIEHFENKFFGSLRAPKGYFGREGDLNSRATLASQDMKWARSCLSLQTGVKNGFHRLCQVQLALRQIDPYSKFYVMMVAPSSLEELTRFDAMNSKIDIADRLASLGETLDLTKEKWREHILKGILGFTDDDVRLYTDDPDATDNGDDPPEDEDVGEFDHLSEFMTKLKGNEVSDFTYNPEYVRKSELPILSELMEDAGVSLSSALPIPEMDEGEDE